MRSLHAVFRGDLGTSDITRRPILRDLLQRLPAPLRLGRSGKCGMAAIACISIGWAALGGRTTRAAMQEALQSDFVRTARAKELRDGPGFPTPFGNALLPGLTVLGLDFGSYLTARFGPKRSSPDPVSADMSSR